MSREAIAVCPYCHERWPIVYSYCPKCRADLRKRKYVPVRKRVDWHEKR